MSWVTEVLLITNILEEDELEIDDAGLENPVITNVHDWLKLNNYGKLDKLNEYIRSGGKIMGSHVYGGAFNFILVDEFIEFVTSQSWLFPASVQLLIKDEMEEKFTLHTIDNTPAP